MKHKGIVVVTILLLPILTVLFSQASSLPEIRNQGQSASAIHPDSSVTLYAQGKDDVALQWAWLSTNEAGTWNSFKGWWNFDWKYCKALRIDHTKVDADLTNFPVLVSIASSDFTTHAQPNGYDFVFTDSTNTTQYNHEIESYTSATGELIAWVNVPLLSSTHDTVLYLYYGNPTCGNQQNIAGTWNSGYLMVHHMNGATFTDLKDSSTHHWDVTSQGGDPTYNQPGKIGKSVDFDPTGSWDFLKVAGFRLPADSTYTVSAWVYVDGSFSSRRYLCEGSSGNGISLLVWTDGQFKAVAGYPDATYAYTYSTTKATGQPQWQYVCSRADTVAEQLAISVNGVQESSTPLTETIIAEPQGLNIGKPSDGTDMYYMNGRIDELRVSNVARSDAWIHTEYTMMSSPSSFLTVSNQFTPGQLQQYGSPMRLQETTQWQWTNFTWHNPTTPQGTTVSWKITYQDTSGNTNQTSTMSFTILGSPPAIPQAPQGPSTGTVGTAYTFSATTTDPDHDDVSYLFDWGDGNQSGWTTFHPSAETVTRSSIWHHVGIYSIKVKAKDVYTAETIWSSSATITITPSPLPALTIHMSSTVNEGTRFEVTVTSNGVPVRSAQVTFHATTYVTNSSGKVALIAPLVDTTTPYSLSAQLTGYQSATTTITVLNVEQPSEEKGWVYGWVANANGGMLSNAKVCALIPGKNTTGLCTFTDDQGRYDIHVPIGTYLVQASRHGYDTNSMPNVVVQENYAIEINLVLQPQPVSTIPTNENRDIIQAVIDAGIATKKITGTLEVQPAKQNYTLTIYNDNLSADVLSINLSDVVFSVAATNFPGTIFAVRLDNQKNVADIAVTVDNTSLKQIGLSEILDVDSSEAVYARMLETSSGETTTYCLVYLPHFSAHQVTITSILQQVHGFGGIIAVAVYATVALIALIILLVPIMHIERKRP